MTDPNNSTSGGRAKSYWVEDRISGSGLSGASKLMTSLPVTVAVLSSIPALSNASLERCMESRELVNGESRDTVPALSALFSLTDSNAISSGAVVDLPAHIQLYSNQEF